MTHKPTPNDTNPSKHQLSHLLVPGGAGFTRRGVDAVLGREVVEARVGAEFLHVAIAGAVLEKLLEAQGLALGIGDGVLVLVAVIDGAHGAAGGAMGEESLGGHVGAEVAFLDGSDAA